MERRTDQRVRAVLKAEIRYNDGMMSTPCVVRDVSEQGARIELPGDITLPNRFDLYIEKKHTTYRVVVRRRNGRELGVAFEDSPPSMDLADRVAKLENDVAELRRILAETAVALKNISS
jgi:hypothetical protein